jgi:hypothetical protein
MTLREIERIVVTLESRHEHLNQETLVTLLKAGGWDEGMIQDAISIFLSRKKAEGGIRASLTQENPSEVTHMEIKGESNSVPLGIGKNDSQDQPASREVTFVSPYNQAQEVSLPAIVEVPGQSLVYIKPDGQEENLVNLQPTEEITQPYNKGEIKPSEPQSLIPESKPLVSASKLPASIPDNLPMRPFDTSPHVWSFSRYKDVFHGEVMAHVTPPVEVVTTPNKEHHHEHVTLEKTPYTIKDESLVTLASFMLLVIMLLLGYMYGNGRL